MFVHARPARSKRAMLADLDQPVATSRLAGRNTLDYTSPRGTRKIRLHDTDIMTFYTDGRIELYTGGFNTHTTRNRMNEFLPAGMAVFTERGVIHARTEQMTLKFRDTATIFPDGRIESDITDAKVDADRKLIDAYMKEWRKKGLPPAEKSGGDPWVFPDPETGKINEHIMRDWLQTKYVFRSLFAMAMKYAGMQDHGVAIRLHMTDRSGGKLDKMELSRIRRFIRACLGYES